VEDQVFGRRYRVLEKIGTGGMADVYKAVDEVLGRTVAVKVMHARYASDPSFAVRFRQEAQAAANLVSPNIVNMYDWGAEGDTYYMVMEYVRGNDLKSIIQEKGALASTKVADIGAQVCAALSVAHGYDIIHRDIKPHNIMVQPDGSVKVMDFGIARAGNTTMTQTGSVLGTAHYVSPEQAQGKDLQATSDLYSLGIVLYEASTGHVPFDADTPVAVALKQVNEQPKPPRAVNPNVDPGLEAVIVKAMQKNPAQRYSSAEEMRRDLQAVAQGGQPAASAAAVAAPLPADQTAVLPTVGATASRASQGRRQAAPTKKRVVWPWLLLVVALALAGIGVAWAAFQAAPISVPDLTNMTQSEATAALMAKGLKVGTITHDYSDTVPVNRISQQDPAAGASAAKGALVSIVISKGPPILAVPNVVGMNATDADKALRGKGFTPVPGVSQFSTAPAGQIIEQNPKAGTQAAKGSKVTYIASKGIQLNAVPNVVGKSKSSATSLLKKADFKVATSTDFSDTVDAGDVISQDPKSGSQYPPKTVVTITVSQGPGIAVPDLSDLTSLSDAISKLKSVGLAPSPSSATTTGTVTINYTAPAAGTKVVKGSKVTIHYTASF
jgi:eukaryotic-like serine/threonine-protein kinase